MVNIKSRFQSLRHIPSYVVCLAVATALAWRISFVYACCSPRVCPPCHSGVWPNCVPDCRAGQNCCDPTKCESCIGMQCMVCGGNPDFFCCSGNFSFNCCQNEHICCHGLCCNPLTSCCGQMMGIPMCVSNCVTGSFCSYDFPPTLLCRWKNIDDWTCHDGYPGQPEFLDGYCGYEIVEGPQLNEIC